MLLNYVDCITPLILVCNPADHHCEYMASRSYLLHKPEVLLKTIEEAQPVQLGWWVYHP